MPVKAVNYFEGNILDYVKNPFGIFKAEIITPKNINIPLLQRFHSLNNVKKTITPLGKWTGIYTSAELNKAIEIGYQIKIIDGYLFEKKVIFKEFVDFFYTLKNKSKKGTPEYLIAKLILNSAYGKLGMSPNLEHHKIINKNELNNIFILYTITNVIEIDDELMLISYF